MRKTYLWSMYAKSIRGSLSASTLGYKGYERRYQLRTDEPRVPSPTTTNFFLRSGLRGGFDDWQVGMMHHRGDRWKCREITLVLWEVQMPEKWQKHRTNKRCRLSVLYKCLMVSKTRWYPERGYVTEAMFKSTFAWTASTCPTSFRHSCLSLFSGLLTCIPAGIVMDGRNQCCVLQELCS